MWRSSRAWTAAISVMVATAMLVVTLAAPAPTGASPGQEPGGTSAPVGRDLPGQASTTDPAAVTRVDAEGRIGDPAVTFDVTAVHHQVGPLYLSYGYVTVTLPDGGRIWGGYLGTGPEPIPRWGSNGAELRFPARGPNGQGELTIRLDDRDAVGAGPDHAELSGSEGLGIEVGGDVVDGHVTVAPTAPTAPPAPAAPTVATPIVETDRATAVVEGTGPPGATVVAEGPGLPPSIAFAGDDGAFSVAVPVPFATTTALEVRTFVPGQPPSAPAVATVHQSGAPGAARISGTVVDSVDGQPIAGATVGYGSQAARSGDDGGFVLDGLPDGDVTVRASAEGHLTGSLVVPVAGGTASPEVRLALAPTTEPETVGRRGGTVEAGGVRLVVPRGAVRQDTPISLTPLEPGAALDHRWGLPLADLGPSGTTFARPVRVEIASPVAMPAGTAVGLRLVNPDTGSAQRVAATVGSDGQTLVFEVSSFDGAEVMIDEQWLREMLGMSPGSGCQAFDAEWKAEMAYGYALGILEILTRDYMFYAMPDIGRMWELYLGSGGFETITDGPLIDGVPVTSWGGFRGAPGVEPARKGIDTEMVLQAGLATRQALPPTAPQSHDIAGSREASFAIPNRYLDYSDGSSFEVPTNIAGGIDTAVGSDVHGPDSRGATGTVTIAGRYDGHGVLTGVTVSDDLTFEIRDTIDFCPSGDLGGETAQLLTVTLSRLEAHGRAADVGFEVEHGPEERDPVEISAPDQEGSWAALSDLPTTRQTLAFLYDNDRDSDGYPEALPGELSSLPLDNCREPLLRNPDQADEDGDGLGDPCDDDDEEPPGGGGGGDGDGNTGAGYGDPHFRTFDEAHYSFQAGGEFVMVRDPDDPGLVVQLRHESRNLISVIDGVAMNVAGDVVVILPERTTVNGDEVAPGGDETSLPEGGRLRLSQTTFEVGWPDGTVVEGWRPRMGNAVEVRLAADRTGVEGLLGDADGDEQDDVLTSAGTPAATFDEIYGDFGPRWVVPDADRLFPGERRPYQAPSAPPPSASELDPAAAGPAWFECRAAGWVSGHGLDECVYDVVVTGEHGYADPAVADLIGDTPQADLNVNAPDLRSWMFTLTGGGGGSGDDVGDGGPANQATLRTPLGVDVDDAGNLYVADADHHRIRRVGPDGIVTTVAGSGTAGDSGDGGPASEAQLSRPAEATLAPDGSLYIADTQNHRLRRVDPDGVITTVAGSGVAGDSGDGGPATEARLDTPTGVTIAGDGTVYVVDAGSNRVRRIGTDGVITSVAGDGTAGSGGDGGPATAAQLDSPRGVSVGEDGSVYIADTRNHRIRRVSPDGIITTVAGNGEAGFDDGDGSATSARLGDPEDVKVGTDGTVIIADSTNDAVRRVDPAGRITTLAGDGTPGAGGDGGPSRAARLNFPAGVSIDTNGDVYVADMGNDRVRLIMAP